MEFVKKSAYQVEIGDYIKVNQGFSPIKSIDYELTGISINTPARNYIRLSYYREVEILKDSNYKTDIIKELNKLKEFFTNTDFLAKIEEFRDNKDREYKCSLALAAKRNKDEILEILDKRLSELESGSLTKEFISWYDDLAVGWIQSIERLDS